MLIRVKFILIILTRFRHVEISTDKGRNLQRFRLLLLLLFNPLVASKICGYCLYSADNRNFLRFIPSDYSAGYSFRFTHHPVIYVLLRFDHIPWKLAGYLLLLSQLGHDDQMPVSKQVAQV
jgi:hypothetical protein